MPNRILREGILSSERVALLSWQEEVFYRRLMSVVDDYGRYHANPKLLRAALYPLLIDKVSDADIGKWLTNCVTAALVSVYPAPDGKRYLQLLDFRQQARADKSKYPAPDGECAADAQQMHSKCAADAPVFVGGDGDVDEGVKETARKRATPLRPEDVSEQVWEDWLRLRKDKRAAVTATVVSQAQAEAQKAGMPFEAFLAEWCARGSQGLKADWLKTKTEPKSFRERDEEAAAARFAAFTGRKVDALDNVIDMEPANARIGNG